MKTQLIEIDLHWPGAATLGYKWQYQHRFTNIIDAKAVGQRAVQIGSAKRNRAIAAITGGMIWPSRQPVIVPPAEIAT